MNYIVDSPKTESEFENYFFLRWKILRKPFNKLLGSEKDHLEKESFHVFIKNESLEIIAVGRLHFINNKIDGQIRFMAVDDEFQGRGYGTILLKKIENIAIKNNIKRIFLHARENAINFYKNNGYKIEKKSHLLFDEIQHWLMKKEV